MAFKEGSESPAERVEDKLLCAEIKPIQGIPIRGNGVWAESVDDMVDVKRGGSLAHTFWIRTDFSTIAEQLDGINPEASEKSIEYFRDSFQRMKGADGKELSENLQRTLCICWRASVHARRILGKPNGNDLSRNNFYLIKKAGNREHLVRILSQCEGEAACLEYSLLAKHILDRIGVKSVIMTEGDMYVDEPSYEQHAYLVLEGGSLIFDPVNSSISEECWPVAVYRPKEMMTPDLLRDSDDLIEATHILTGQKAHYG